MSADGVGCFCAQDQIIEVMDDMKAYRPTSRAWQERVAPGVVKLAKRTMPWLSVRAALCAVCVQERGRRKRWVGRTDSCG